MVNTNARDLVEAAEKTGLTHKQMAQICEVSPVTIYRWKMLGIARTSAISRLKRYLENPEGERASRKSLDEASLEDLAARARDLGFRITFTDLNVKHSLSNAAADGNADMLFNIKEGTDYLYFMNKFELKEAEQLCHSLIHGPRGVTLGKKVLEQLDQGHLDHETYSMLSRWVNPRRAEHFAQPLAAKISKILYGKEIDRI